MAITYLTMTSETDAEKLSRAFFTLRNLDEEDVGDTTFYVWSKFDHPTGSYFCSPIDRRADLVLRTKNPTLRPAADDAIQDILDVLWLEESGATQDAVRDSLEKNGTISVQNVIPDNLPAGIVEYEYPEMESLGYKIPNLEVNRVEKIEYYGTYQNNI